MLVKRLVSYIEPVVLPCNQKVTLVKEFVMSVKGLKIDGVRWRCSLLIRDLLVTGVDTLDKRPE